ncbi:D-ribitol-5-phosphate cytidylyltransferase-like [Cimex lectularius]|uniref:D-ribitol-5-phosphate cytidylyltransferase n=1 Tax=Cimex lectularius TaxID=79782 RepID=A0A8I6RHE4_CIMLE|nr:D-ribitol-5-phosphate cytidylyltransferase-like [Cimex lectularius]
MIDFNVGVILAAAGRGTRLACPVPKQYISIWDKPLFLYSLEEFLASRYIKRIALVVDDVSRVNDLLLKHDLNDTDRVSVVQGSDRSRHASIKLGLQHIEKKHQDEELKVIVVHDAVRPFVPQELLMLLVKAAAAVGSAGPTKPLVSTVLKKNAESFLEASLNRNLYVASETPQAFQFEILSSAYSKITDEELENGTECLQLVLSHCGIKPKLIPTTEDLTKVTYQQDVNIVEAALRSKTTDVCIISEDMSEELTTLSQGLVHRVGTMRTMIGKLAKNRDMFNGKVYNTIILLHMHEIEQDLHLLDFANLIDMERQGLIIHIIHHASIDGLQNMSVYNLNRNSRKMAHNYEKFHKGVVVIHCVSSNDIQLLTNVVISLVQADPQTFSGQNLFL